MFTGDHSWSQLQSGDVLAMHSYVAHKMTTTPYGHDHKAVPGAFKDWLIFGEWAWRRIRKIYMYLYVASQLVGIQSKPTTIVAQAHG